MIALPNFATNLAQTEDSVTIYPNLVYTEAKLGLALSGEQKICTKR